MTVAPERVSANHWPGLDGVPTGPRAQVSAAIARKIFKTALARLAVTVHVGDGPGGETWGRGGPVATIHRPEEFFARLGRHPLIGFGEAYQVGAWSAEDLGGFPADTGMATRAGTPLRTRARSLQLLRVVG